MRIGVDEAGKGPVLGSMFVAAVRANPGRETVGAGPDRGDEHRAQDGSLAGLVDADTHASPVTGDG